MEKIRAIHQWAASNIEYDYNAYLEGDNTMRAASETIKRGKGTCRDYSFVVAALARALGIPARVVYGSAAGTGGWDAQLHAWNEAIRRRALGHRGHHLGRRIYKGRKVCNLPIGQIFRPGYRGVCQNPSDRVGYGLLEYTPKAITSQILLIKRQRNPQPLSFLFFSPLIFPRPPAFPGL
ncbi:MAG: transglutaminase domain-containing protein [Clostridia bacterium]